MDYQGGQTGHSVAEVQADGLQVSLEDGSRWQVYKGFAARAAAWSAGEMITVKPSKDDQYPYLLVNVHKNESVEACLAYAKTATE